MTTQRLSGLVGAGLVAVATLAVAAQPDEKTFFKGKLKPGMYETKIMTDLTGMPGIPKEQQKTTETTKRCVTAAELDEGVETRSDCNKSKTVKQIANGIEITAQCRDGSLQELRMTTTANGFATDLKSSSKQHTMTMKTESRYLGAC